MNSLFLARRRRQFIVAVFIFGILSYVFYSASFSTMTISDHGNHSHPPPSSSLTTPEQLPAEYGSTARPPFKDIIHDSQLSPKLLPKLPNYPDSEGEGRRLIFIGDVHGMLVPLKQLLENIKFDAAAGDHVVFVGDMITKGPDSVDVVEYAMDIGASSVRGNHEDRVLLAAQELALEHRRRKHHQKLKLELGEEEVGDKDEHAFVTADEYNTDFTFKDDQQFPLLDPMEEEHFSHGNSKDRHLARQLSTHQLTWLASLPVILKIGHLPNMGEVVAVHAGLVPGISLEKQDPWAVMNMRTLVFLGDEVRTEFARQAVESARRAQETDEEKKERINVNSKESEVIDLAMRDKKSWDNNVFIPVASRKGERWAKVWDKEMKTIARKQDSYISNDIDADADAIALKKESLISVVFGHDSKRGLQMGRWTYGIDSGCVRGGQLTALIVEASPNGKHVKTSVESVDCRSAGRAAEDEDDF